jgi:hypothetical protein
MIIGMPRETPAKAHFGGTDQFRTPDRFGRIISMPRDVHPWVAPDKTPAIGSPKREHSP